VRGTRTLTGDLGPGVLPGGAKGVLRPPRTRMVRDGCYRIWLHGFAVARHSIKVDDRFMMSDFDSHSETSPETGTQHDADDALSRLAETGHIPDDAAVPFDDPWSGDEWISVDPDFLDREDSVEIGPEDSGDVRLDAHEGLGEEHEDLKPEPGTEDVDPDEYDRQAAATADLNILVGALEDVTEQLRALAQSLTWQSREAENPQPRMQQQLDLAEQLVPQVQRLTGTARAIVARGKDQEADLAFSATAQMMTLKSDLKYARKQYPTTRLWARIWATLKKALPRLWSIISHLVTVKEWSITGQAGIPVLNLVQTSISITFGKQE
jgi:hypothetical protein